MQLLRRKHSSDHGRSAIEVDGPAGVGINNWGAATRELLLTEMVAGTGWVFSPWLLSNLIVMCTNIVECRYHLRGLTMLPPRGVHSRQADLTLFHFGHRGARSGVRRRLLQGLEVLRGRYHWHIQVLRRHYVHLAPNVSGYTVPLPAVSQGPLLLHSQR